MARKPHHSQRLALFALLTAIAVVVRTFYKRMVRKAKTNKARSEDHVYLSTTSDREHCDIEGLRFLAGALSADTLQEITEEASMDPIRIYAGLGCGKTVEERVGFTLDEMDMLNAWDRKAILIVAPTGRGYVHGVPIEVAEIAYRGDHATVAVQYADDRSMRAINKLDDGILAHTLLLEAIYERLDERSRRNMSVPQVGVYGESMGAWASLEAMLDVSRLPDRALWVGAPKPLRKRTMPRVAQRVYDAEAYFEESDGPPTGLVPYLALTNDDDPIAYFEGMKTMLLPTRWARKHKFWLPGATWAKLIVEIEAQTRPERGVMGTAKHDYRGHMPGTIPMVFGGEKLTAEQVTWLTRREQTRHEIFSFLYTLPVDSK